MTGEQLQFRYQMNLTRELRLQEPDWASASDDYKRAWNQLAAEAEAKAAEVAFGPKPEWPEGVNQYEGIPLWREPKPELAWDRLAQLAARPRWFDRRVINHAREVLSEVNPIACDELKEFAKEMPPICTCGEGTVKHFPDCPAHDA